jgi:hypothetical protein
VAGAVVLNTNSVTSDINGPDCVNRQMMNWGTSARKQEELCELLDQWYINFSSLHRSNCLKCYFIKLQMLIFIFIC